MKPLWYLLEGINPEPWTAGTAYRRGARGVGVSKNAALTAYQEAVAEEVRQITPDVEPLRGELSLDVWFWRERVQGRWTDSGRLVTKRAADRSNMLKAFEDALQGVLYVNDNQIVTGRTQVVEQSTTTEPKILFRLGDGKIDTYYVDWVVNHLRDASGFVNGLIR